MATRLLKLCLLLVFALILSACQTGVDPTGEYELVAVDGLKVPATVSHDDAKMQIHSGWFKINEDGTCSCCSIFSPPSSDEQIERVVDATYTQEESTLNMQWEGAGQTIGTVDGDTFTMDNHGTILTYKKKPSD